MTSPPRPHKLQFIFLNYLACGIFLIRQIPIMLLLTWLTITQIHHHLILKKPHQYVMCARCNLLSNLLRNL